MEAKRDWLETTGGPIVVCSRAQAQDWTGADGPDYDEACSVQSLTGTAKITQQSEVLILGDEPFRTAILTDLAGAVGIVRWCYAEDESSLIDAVLSFDLNSKDPEEVIEWNAGGRDCVLFDSSSPFSDAKQELSLALPAERVIVKTWDVKPDRNTNAILHQFRALTK